MSMKRTFIGLGVGVILATGLIQSRIINIYDISTEQTVSPTMIKKPMAASLSNNKTETLPPLQVNDYFIYDFASYNMDGLISNSYTSEEKVVDVDKNSNDVFWVIYGSSKNKHTVRHTKQWVSSSNGNTIRYEDENSYPNPIDVIVENNNKVKVLRDKRIFTNDYYKYIYVDTTGVSHESLYPGSSVINLYKIIQPVKIGDILNGRQVIDIKKISVPAGTFTCWLTKLLQGNGQHQYYYYYFDISTGLLVRHDNMVNNKGRWQLIEKTELKKYHLSN